MIILTFIWHSNIVFYFILIQDMTHDNVMNPKTKYHQKNNLHFPDTHLKFTYYMFIIKSSCII